MGFLVQGFYTQKFKVSNVIFRTLELTDGQGSRCSAGLSVADPLQLAQSGGLPQEPLDEGPQVPGHQVYQTGEELHPVNINYLSSLKQNIFNFLVRACSKPQATFCISIKCKNCKKCWCLIITCPIFDKVLDILRMLSALKINVSCIGHESSGGGSVGL